MHCMPAKDSFLEITSLIQERPCWRVSSESFLAIASHSVGYKTHNCLAKAKNAKQMCCNNNN